MRFIVRYATRLEDLNVGGHLDNLRILRAVDEARNIFLGMPRAGLPGLFDGFGAHVAPFVGYLASPRSQRISGYVFVVWGRQVTMVEGPKLGAVFESEEQWTMDTLDRQLSPHFEQLRPILDGFAVIPGQ